MNSKIIKQAESAKKASIKLATASTKDKNNSLNNIADAIEANKEKILEENKKDIAEAEKNNLKDTLLKRLKLDEVKIDEIIKGLRDVVKLDDPIGKTISAVELDKNLELYQISCPIGVIGIIFESRPDALVQISSLCLKSGNSVILKGGSEAKHTNRILFEIIKNEKILPKGWIQLIETRKEVKEILKMDAYIDLLIPRGSNEFVKYIQDNTKIPVLGHSSGICHIYVDKNADLDMALNICFDAKCQYAAVCNAMETLLVNKDVAEEFLPLIIKKYLDNNVELRLDNSSFEIIEKEKSLKNNKKIKKASEEDWGMEYNDLILSIKIVNNVDEVIEHINRYSSKHTDAIITENKETASKFMDLVDSSSLMWNCSIRFSDGFRYSKGAEVGISTNKIHARGPVGLEGLVIYKYKLIGNGQIVADYTGKDAKTFTHKKLDKSL